MNKLIGVVGHPMWGDKVKKFGVNEAYVDYFRNFGNVITIDSLSDGVIPVDLLVVPGGADVNPLRYGQKPHKMTQSPDLNYEWFDTVMLPEYIKAGIPIFGICRGLQTLNVHFGGALHQDIYQSYSDTDRSKLVDTLIMNPENQVFDIPSQWVNGVFKSKAVTSKDAFYKVNSLHHQGCDISNISEEMLILATNKTYKNVEAMRHKKLPIIAVQWHPEELVNPKYSNQLIKYLLNL